MWHKYTIFHYYILLITDCTDTFAKSDDMNGSGGIQESGVNTEAACRTACLAKSFEQCGAYDFNTAANTCWLFTTAPSSLNSADNIDHYRREQCAGK